MMRVEQLLAAWHELPVLVWDVETTGVDPATDRVVQVACALFCDGELVRSASSLVNPGIPIPETSTAIHGLRDVDVVGAPDLFAAMHEVASGADCEVESVAACAYNASFDRAFLEPVARGALVGLHPELPWLDPLVMVRVEDKFVRGAGRHKLSAACERRGIEIGNAHTAEADAIAAGRLLYSFKAISQLTICEVLRRQEMHRAQQEREFAEWKAKQPVQVPA